MEQKEYDLIDLVRFCWSVWVRYAWNPLVYLFRFALQKWYVLLVAAIIGVGIHMCFKRVFPVSYSSEMNVYYAIDTPTELINKVNSLNYLSQAERAQLLGLSQEDANEWERVSPYFMLKSKEITGLYTVDYDNKWQQDHELIAPHILCLQVVTKNQFANKLKKGDVMVGGANFGCGSSREHAPIAIKASGISLVIAKTFARIFYRNAINIGLAILECPEAVANINDGDKVEADLDNGVIYNRTTGKSFKTQPFPEFIQKIITNGGLIESIRRGDIK